MNNFKKKYQILKKNNYKILTSNKFLLISIFHVKLQFTKNKNLLKLFKNLAKNKNKKVSLLMRIFHLSLNLKIYGLTKYILVCV
jgi:hypothetical protein